MRLLKAKLEHKCKQTPELKFFLSELENILAESDKFQNEVETLLAAADAVDAAQDHFLYIFNGAVIGQPQCVSVGLSWDSPNL